MSSLEELSFFHITGNINMSIVYRIKMKLADVVGRKTSIKFHKKCANQIDTNDLTIICQNCLGGVIYHDLGMKFLSPTINLYMESEDYITFLENLESFRSAPIRFVESDRDYPVGIIRVNNKQIKVYFVHYHSEEEAVQKWNERYQRINYSNLMIIMTDRDGFNQVIFDRFMALPYKNKVLFTSKKYDNECCYFVKEFKNDSQVGDLIHFVSLNGKRSYERSLNIVKYINLMERK